MNSDYYPAGAYHDTNAPYNQREIPEIEVKCDVMVSVVREGVPVMTDNYTRDEDGIDVMQEYLTDDYENGHHDIPELLGELAKYINGELAGGVTGERRRQLLGILADCQGWRTEVTSIEDFSL